MTDSLDDNQETWPISQRDYPPAAIVLKKTTYQLQVLEPDGHWMFFGGYKESRDEMTLVQADRLRRYPDEKRRVAVETVTLVIEEIEGDGEGETSAEALIARNEAITKRLLATADAAAKRNA